MPARHLVAWIRQESSGIRHLWRSTDSEVSSLFSGLSVFVQQGGIRLSDKASRLRPRLAAPARGQAYQAKMAVQMREWIALAPSSPDLVLETQPPAQPHRGVGVESAIRP